MAILHTPRSFLKMRAAEALQFNGFTHDFDAGDWSMTRTSKKTKHEKQYLRYTRWPLGRTGDIDTLPR